MKLKELIQALNLDLKCNGDTEIVKICENAEDVEQDDLLILIKPISGKAPCYEAKREKVPAAIICESDAEISAKGSDVIRVPSARVALAVAYSLFYKIDYERLKIIGVTGTNGKTTTATLIKKILERSGKKVGFIGTGKIEICERRITDDYYSMTTPDPRLLYPALAKMQSEGCEYCVMEISSHAIALGKVAPITLECALFTNLSPEHLDFHRDMDDYFKTKLSLFEKSRQAVFNVDDEYGNLAAKSYGKTKTTVGILAEADVSAYEIKNNGYSGYQYIYRGKGYSFLMRQRLPGAHNVYNVLMAVACSYSLGVKPCIAREAVEEIYSISGRCEIIKDEITVIIDYAHTPGAFKNILSFAASLKKGKSKLHAVFGCGGERDRQKRPEMAKIAESAADRITVTADNSRKESTDAIIADILCGFRDMQKVSVINDRKEAINSAIAGAQNGDTVIICGKGAEKYNIDEKGYHPFDDLAVAKDAIAQRHTYEN